MPNLPPQRAKNMDDYDGPEQEAHWIPGVGHIHNIDCWCEPIYYIAEAENGDRVLIVEHEPTPDNISRASILEIREREHDWITVLFNTL